MLDCLKYEEMELIIGNYFQIKYRFFASESAAELLKDYENTGVHAFAMEGDTVCLYDMAYEYMAGRPV